MVDFRVQGGSSELFRYIGHIAFEKAILMEDVPAEKQNGGSWIFWIVFKEWEDQSIRQMNIRYIFTDRLVQAKLTYLHQIQDSGIWDISCHLNNRTSVLMILSLKNIRLVISRLKTGADLNTLCPFFVSDASYLQDEHYRSPESSDILLAMTSEIHGTINFTMDTLAHEYSDKSSIR